MYYYCIIIISCYHSWNYYNIYIIIITSIIVIICIIHLLYLIQFNFLLEMYCFLSSTEIFLSLQTTRLY